jgi:putative transport protein
VAAREGPVRAYCLPEAHAGRSVEDFERAFSPARVFVQRIRRGSAVLDAGPGAILQPGDTVVVAARRHVLLAEGSPLGQEVEDRELLDFPMAALDVVVTRGEIAERSLSDIAEEHGRGVVLQKLIRGGEEIPFAPGTLVNRGDLLRIAGAEAEAEVERVGKALGYVERPSSETDVVFVGLGMLLGGLLGALTWKVGDLPLSLARVHGAVRDRQHPAHRLGTGDRDAHEIGGRLIVEPPHGQGPAVCGEAAGPAK